MATRQRANARAEESESGSLSVKTRAAIYGGAGLLLAAYFAAANSAPRQQPPPARRATEHSAPSPDAIARDMLNDAARLRDQMQRAPVPDANPRNPFAFGDARVPKPPAASIARATVADGPDGAAAAPAMPELSLIGMAEDSDAKGVRRTAVLAGAGDAVYFVTEGDTLLGRYRVSKIDNDVVELEDVLTHGFRRLAMR